MVLLFLGISGSGKDTQAELIASKFGYQVLSTGGIIREQIEAETPIGQQIHAQVAKGDWVDDEVVYDLLSKKLASVDSDDFILTGAVRDANQVGLLDSALHRVGYNLDKVVFFDLSAQEAERRLSGRRYDNEGNMYHIEFNPPPTGLEVHTREDDKPSAIQHRINEFNQTIEPILQEYEARGVLLRVDASPDIQTIHADLVIKLGFSVNDIIADGH